MIILNNEKIDSRSGPAKSINLLRSKVLKNRKYIYCFFGDNKLYFDLIINDKKKEKIFFLFINYFFLVKKYL